jgi:hypothetical protein
MTKHVGPTGILVLASALAAAQTPQMPLDGRSLPQFVDPLPALETIVAGPDAITLHMREFRSTPLPAGFESAHGDYAGTWTWGYLQDGETAAIRIWDRSSSRRAASPRRSAG